MQLGLCVNNIVFSFIAQASNIGRHTCRVATLRGSLLGAWTIRGHVRTHVCVYEGLQNALQVDRQTSGNYELSELLKFHHIYLAVKYSYLPVVYSYLPVMYSYLPYMYPGRVISLMWSLRKFTGSAVFSSTEYKFR